MGSERVTLGRAGVWVAVVWALAGGVAAAQPKAPADDADFPPLRVIALDVVDPATNKPVEGVRITGRVSNQQRTWVTGEDGHAKLDVDGGARSLTIVATKDGYVPTTVTWSGSRAGEAIPGDYLLKLERGTTIGGRVVDEAGKPVAGAEVALSIQRKGDRPQGGFTMAGVVVGPDATERASLSDARAKTDPDGRWRYDQAPAKVEPIRLRVTHPDYLSDEGFTTRTPPPEEKLRDGSAVIVMSPGVTIAGRVVDPAGKPVAGATVSLGVTGFRAKLRAAKSREDGRFSLAHCRPGQQATLLVRADGWAPAAAQLPVDKDVADLEVKLEPGRAMHIRVVDAKGHPVSGATLASGMWRGVTDLGWRATTGADGRVTWDDAPADAVAIVASAQGFVSATERAVVAGEPERVITLAAMDRVAGTVLDDATGKPVERFRASVASPARPGAAAFVIPETASGVSYGAAGTFVMLQNVRRPAYTVRVEAAGYLPATSREIKAGEENVALEFRLKRGRDVVGILKTPDGAPLAGADVVLVTESTQAIIRSGKVSPQTVATRTKSDPAGRFRFDPQAGAYTLLVVHDRGYAEVPAERLAAPDEPAVVVGPWATIKGTAWVGSTPAAGQTVTAMDPSGRRAVRARIDCSAVANERGEFVLDRVAPGSVSVGIEMRQESGDGASRVTRVQWTQQRAVEAEAGKTTEVRLGGSGRAVVGRLVAPAEVGDKADWKFADVRLTVRIPSKRQLPADWATMSPEARLKLDEEWFKSPEGQAEMKRERQARRSYRAAVSATDGTFRAEDVEAGDYFVSAQLSRPAAAGAPTFAAQTWAAARVEITVADGKADEAVDVGKVELSTSPGGPNPIRRMPTRAPARVPAE